MGFDPGPKVECGSNTMAVEVLDPRKQRILQAVVHEHILTAEPVGSAALVGRYGLDVSAATIRNEMAALTEMGYLHQPHPSAGRVPTERAYRLYVDTMVQEERIPVEERRRILRTLSSVADEAERAVEHAAHELAHLLEYPSVGAVAAAEQRRFLHVQFVPFAEDRVAVVVVTDAGSIEGTLLRLPAPVPPGDLERLSRWLSEGLRGKTLGEVREGTLARIRVDRPELGLLLRRLEEALQAYLTARGPGRVFVEGHSNILKQPEFRDVRAAQPVLSALDREEVVWRLLRPLEGEVRVTIGPENPVAQMWRCSVVSATYRVGNRPAGVIGVVGPMRMPYGRVIALVRALARLLSTVLSRAAGAH
ncbi:MAG: heat-inducible transcriptional repressor HrcA [Armatimonadota bacterium]|nr:heat-inducible transcriptional repressor HrcA [Armatimonadota bacterium]